MTMVEIDGASLADGGNATFTVHADQYKTQQKKMRQGW